MRLCWSASAFDRSALAARGPARIAQRRASIQPCSCTSAPSGRITYSYTGSTGWIAPVSVGRMTCPRTVQRSRRGSICHDHPSASREAVHGLILLEAFESVGRHGGVAHGMLNILMPQIILNRPGIMPPRCQVIAARMPELVGMGYKREPGQPARSRHNLPNRPRGQGRLALGDEHIRRVGMGALEFPQEAQLRAA
jgi:hypothetical protein